MRDRMVFRGVGFPMLGPYAALWGIVVTLCPDGEYPAGFLLELLGGFSEKLDPS